MIKVVGIASLCAGLGYGMMGPAFAQAYSPPMDPPSTRYMLPEGVDVYPLNEGRSVYRMSDPGAFYNGSDEKGYPTGLPQNPQTPD
jgi:hypothetical protein